MRARDQTALPVDRAGGGRYACPSRTSSGYANSPKDVKGSEGHKPLPVGRLHQYQPTANETTVRILPLYGSGQVCPGLLRLAGLTWEGSLRTVPATVEEP